MTLTGFFLGNRKAKEKGRRKDFKCTCTMIKYKSFTIIKYKSLLQSEKLILKNKQ